MMSTVHRFHPAQTADEILWLIRNGQVPADFDGDPSREVAVLFDHCDRCDEHAQHPDLSLDSINLERLRWMRGQGEFATAADRLAALNLAAEERA